MLSFNGVCALQVLIFQRLCLLTLSILFPILSTFLKRQIHSNISQPQQQRDPSYHCALLLLLQLRTHKAKSEPTSRRAFNTVQKIVHSMLPLPVLLHLTLVYLTACVIGNIIKGLF